MPKNAQWYAFGIGAMQMPYVALSCINGGHARVGLEDNIFVRAGELAKSNAELVSKASRIIQDLGFDLATPNEARQILGIMGN
jgi:uncharacterized protein (DUF849 family)